MRGDSATGDCANGLGSSLGSSVALLKEKERVIGGLVGHVALLE